VSASRARGAGLRVILAAWSLALSLLIVGGVVHAQAATYACRVTDVWSPLVIPEADYLERIRPTVRVEESLQGAVVTRCARDPAWKRVDCQRIEIDWVDVNAGAGSRKYYRFAEHYDLQIFFDRSFVENDGRGVVYHGQCERTEA